MSSNREKTVTAAEPGPTALGPVGLNGVARNGGLRLSKRGLAQRIGEATESQPTKVRKSSLQMPITRYLAPAPDVPLSSASPPTRMDEQENQSGTPTDEIGALVLSESVTPVKTTIKPVSRPAQPVRRQSARLSRPTPDSIDAAETSSRKRHHSSAGLKSVLAKYFPNYFDIMTGSESVIESNPGRVKVSIISSPVHLTTSNHISTGHNRPRTRPWNTRTVQVVKLPVVTAPPAKDPLNDDLFLKTHKQAERREKQMRNLEKEHVQHEKHVVAQLLDDLHGPRWQHILGIGGSSDAGNKEWERKRDYFIRQLDLLVGKFRTWKEEERLWKQKLADRDRPPAPVVLPRHLTAQTASKSNEDGDAGSDSPSVSPPPSSSRAGSERRRGRVRIPSRLHISASASASASTTASVSASDVGPEFTIPKVEPSRDEAPASPTVWAFGMPIPQIDSMEFQLPADLTTSQNLMANARRRRHQRREIRAKTSS